MLRNLKKVSVQREQGLDPVTRHSYSEEKAQALALWNDRLLGIIRGKTAAKVLPLKRTKRGRG